MAESVARVKIQATADLKGFDDATKALKDLQRAVGPTDAALAQARQEILDFAAANKRSEAVIQAQLNAFQKLRQQAEMGGQVYNELGRDIEKLKQTISGSTVTLNKFGQAVNNATKSSGGKSVWQREAESLAAFNKQAGQTGKAIAELGQSFNIKFEKAGKAIEDASRQLEILKRNASSVGTLATAPRRDGGLFEVPRKGLQDIQAFAQLVRGLKEQAETATGKVARLSEGMFALGATGVGVSAVVQSLGGVASAAQNVSSFVAKTSGAFAQLGAGTPQWASLIKGGLNEISLLLNQPANGVANWVQSLGSAQAKLSALNTPLEAFNTAIAAIGPEGAAAAGIVAVAFAGLQDAISRAFKAGEKDASEALQGITNETQQLLQKLAQLSEAFRSAASMRELQALRSGALERFNETPAGTDASRRAANTIASAEARIKAEGLAQAEVLEAARQRYRGTTESVDALSERLAFLQSAMKLVDQSTTEGKAEFAAFSSEATQLKRQIDQLSNSYRTVADAIREAGRAQGEYANQSTVANYFNRAAVRQQEEIADAARAALARPQTPLLPAGDTSLPAVRGGARQLSNFEVAGTSEQVGAAMGSLSSALDRVSGAVNRAENELNELQKELNETLRDGQQLAQALTEIEFVNPNSINALRSRREQIDKERNSVDMLSRDYKRLSAELAKVDRQLERTQTGGLSGKVGYIGQGIGAAASAGIFGGPEGLLGGIAGGAIGALVGGPAGFAAGAFTGSSIGAYTGMARQQAGGFADYAAQLEKQRIALKGVAGSAAEYERALSAAQSVSDRFNVPIGETTKSMTQLSAAVIGAGGRVADAEVVYKNITAAIKATGGGAEEVQGALTAMAQIFSKGKVSAEELQGQLGERLPGAVTAFAKATGRTLPQLQKDLEQGVVGLNDVMKFVVSLGDQYTATADKISKSEADAGQRFQKTLADFRAAVGKELIPLGSELQGAMSDLLKEITPGAIAAAKGMTIFTQGILGAIKAFGDLTAPFRQFFGTAIPAYLATATAFWRKLDNDLKSFWGRVGSFVRQVGDWFNGLFTGIADIGKKSLRAIGIDTDWLAGVFRNVVKFLGDAWNGFFDFVAKRWRETVRNMVNFTNPLFFVLEKAGVVDVGGAVADALAAGGGSIQASQAPAAPVLPPPSGGLSTFEDPAGKDPKEQAEKEAKDRADAATKEAERLAAEEQRRQETLAKAKIALDDAVFSNSMELLRKRYDYEEERLRSQQNLWAKTFVGIRRESAQAAVDLEERLRGIDSRVRDAQLELYQAEQGLKSARATEQATSFGLGDTVGTSVAAAAGGTGRLSSQAQALVAAARKLGVSPLDLATIIGFETAGTYSPSKRGGAGGNYMGLIQFGPNERRAYGAHSGQTFEEQVTGPVVRYFQDRFKGVGMSTQGADLLTLYRTVLGGNPRASLTGRDAFGTSPQSGVARMAPHRSEALRRFFGGSVSNIPSGAVGVAAQMNRNIAADGSVDVAKAQVAAAQQNVKLTREQAEILKDDTIQNYLKDRLTGLRTEAEQLDMSNQLLLERQRLEAAGTRPEFVEAGLRVKQLEIEREKELAQIRENARQFPERQAVYNEELERTSALYDVLIDAEYQMAEAKTAQGVALANYIGQLKLQLQELTSLESIAIRVGQTLDTEISSAMSNAVSAVVTGSGSVKEALGNMFQSIGQSFVKMATDIIAKQMVMIVMQSILKSLGGGLFGGGGGGGFPVTGLNFLGGSSPLPTSFAANGATFANGTAKFAKGGVVNRPTFFKFANGGTMQNGVMGEAGPEAIVPLKRGYDGRLGIAQVKAPQGGDTRMRDMMGRSPAQQQAPTLNLKFETTKINGVEYVSKDQLEIAMAQTRRQAANDGAKRGMNMTLDKIQNSPSTRSRVGIR